MPRNSDDIASFKQSIDYLSGKIDELSGIKHEVSQILCLVNKLKSIITEKDEQIGVLEARIDDLEQYQKKQKHYHLRLKNKQNAVEYTFISREGFNWGKCSRRRKGIIRKAGNRIPEQEAGHRYC